MIDWLEPATLPDALQNLADYGDEAKIIAGGTWVTLVLSQGFLFPEALIALRQIPGLDAIFYHAREGLQIGAMVTHRQVERDATVRAYYPMLAQTFGEVASVRVRNQATVGGCLCDADYASDPPAMLTALDAAVHLENSEDVRVVAVGDFITGHYETVIQPDEVLTHVTVPPLPIDARGHYLKFRTRSHEDRPCVGVAVVMATEGEAVYHLRVVVGAVAERPQRFAEVESMALGERMSPELAQRIADAYADSIDPIDDLRGSSWYRDQMIRALVRRALLEVAS